MPAGGPPPSTHLIRDERDKLTAWFRRTPPECLADQNDSRPPVPAHPGGRRRDVQQRHIAARPPQNPPDGRQVAAAVSLQPAEGRAWKERDNGRDRPGQKNDESQVVRTWHPGQKTAQSRNKGQTQMEYPGMGPGPPAVPRRPTRICGGSASRPTGRTRFQSCPRPSTSWTRSGMVSGLYLGPPDKARIVLRWNEKVRKPGTRKPTPTGLAETLARGRGGSTHDYVRHGTTSRYRRRTRRTGNGARPVPPLRHRHPEFDAGSSTRSTPPARDDGRGDGSPGDGQLTPLPARLPAVNTFNAVDGPSDRGGSWSTFTRTSASGQYGRAGSSPRLPRSGIRSGVFRRVQAMGAGDSSVPGRAQRQPQALGGPRPPTHLRRGRRTVVKRNSQSGH